MSQHDSTHGGEPSGNMTDVLSKDSDIIGEFGAWTTAKVVTDEFSNHNATVATEQHVEAVDEVDMHIMRWRHNDGKTWLTVSEHTSGHWWVRVEMGGEEITGPGWTCGVGEHFDNPDEAVEWAREYMANNDDVSHLYDD